MNENVLNNTRIRRPEWLKVKIKVDDDLSLANTIQKVNILEMSKGHMVGRIIKN